MADSIFLILLAVNALLGMEEAVLKISESHLIMLLMEIFLIV
jgi:hypothetical protein